jgi:uncharacterized protein YuzE
MVTKVTYDRQADVLYVPLQAGAPVDHSVLIDEDRALDVEAQGQPVGIELLGASHGVHLMDLVDRFDLRAFRGEFEEIEGLTLESREYA